MKIKKGDKVRVVAGKDKGRESIVERVYEKSAKVLVKDTNIYKRHIKKNDKMPQGGVVDIPRPLDVAKVMLVCPKCGKLTRIGYVVERGEKYRICKQCKQKNLINILMSFQQFYQDEVKKKLMEELKIENPMAIPRILKVVVNVGVGEAVSNKNVIGAVQEQLALIAGQKPVVTKARKSISAFKVRKGMPIGVKVTLRGRKMYDFIEKLVKVVIPRLRDFRGIADSSVDPHGNLNLGLTEQTLFPEIEFDKIDKIRGLEVTIVTDARQQDKGRKLFELLGVPFKK